MKQQTNLLQIGMNDTHVVLSLVENVFQIFTIWSNLQYTLTWIVQSGYGNKICLQKYTTF